MRWAQRHRIKYIANLLQSRGFVNRKDLIQAFEISMPQASTDLKAFISENPGVMTYNASAKRYERSTVGKAKVVSEL